MKITPVPPTRPIQDKPRPPKERKPPKDKPKMSQAAELEIMTLHFAIKRLTACRTKYRKNLDVVRQCNAEIKKYERKMARLSQ